MPWKELGNTTTTKFWRHSLLYNVLLQIKRDYAAIKQEALELSQLQREMAVAFQKDFQQTVLKLQALTDKEAASHVSCFMTLQKIFLRLNSILGT